ncbi:hypothetical protein QE152_g29795 [Popillia japonica]|uniref:Uncharacterized protein n=1 Tax=Popillia japonica TaxID=7064 RepID=A0AAW1JFX7_POPJA
MSGCGMSTRPQRNKNSSKLQESATGSIGNTSYVSESATGSIGNTSYVSVISALHTEKNDESEILTELRNRLASSDYAVEELKCKVEEYEEKAKYYKSKYENQIMVNENLQKTITELINQIKNCNGKDVSSQTDPPQVCSQVSQTAVAYKNMKSNIQDTNTDRTNILKNDVKNVSNCNLMNGIIPTGSGQENDSNSNPQAIVNKTKTSLVEQASPPGIKRRILIVADSHGRGFTEELREMDSIRNYNVLTIFKPNACIENVVENLVPLTEGFNNDDCVIILGGTNNALRGRGVPLGEEGASSNNASKEGPPGDLTHPNLDKVKMKYPSTGTTTKKPKIHDDFSDLLDYTMLDSIEREKHRIEVDRFHPVIQKSQEGDLIQVGNPTIAELLNLDLRL